MYLTLSVLMLILFDFNHLLKSKGKVFYCQWRIYYHRIWGQLSTTCSNATEVALLRAHSCSRPQPATDISVRDGRSNWLAVTIRPAQGSTPWAPRIARCIYGPQITRLTATSEPRTRDLRNARPTQCLCSHSAWRHFGSLLISSTESTTLSPGMQLESVLSST